MIEFECPSCGALGRVPESMSGKEHSCSSCGSLLEIPEIEPTTAIGSPVGAEVDNSANSTLELKPETKTERPHAPGKREPSKSKGNVPCSRCGNFMSKADVYPGEKPICDDCYDKFGGIELPFDRNSWDIGSALGFAWERYTDNNNWITIVVANVLVGVIGMVFGVFAQIGVAIGAQIHPAVGIILYFCVQIAAQMFQGLLGMGLVTMIFACLTDREMELGDLFKHLNRFGQFIVYWLVAALIFIGIGVCAAVPAGIAIAAANAPEVGILIGAAIGLPLVLAVLPVFAMAQFEFAYNTECSGIEAFQNALALVRSQWLPIVGALIIAGLVGMLGVFACGIGLLFTMPLAMVMNATVYLALRNNSGLTPVADEI